MKPVSQLLRGREGNLWQVHPEESVFTALQLLAQHDAGALLVMDQGRLVGIVSERDYTRKVALQGRNSRDTPVADIMTRNVIHVDAATLTTTCMALMSEKRIRHLPVMESGALLGMISIRDLMDDIIATQEETIAQLEGYITS